MTEIPQITDSHCHLDFPDFEGRLGEVVRDAAKAGVTRMVTICTKLHNEPAVRAIAEAHPSVFYAAGTHPMSAADEPTTCAASSKQTMSRNGSGNNFGSTKITSPHDDSFESGCIFHPEVPVEFTGSFFYFQCVPVDTLRRIGL